MGKKIKFDSLFPIVLIIILTIFTFSNVFKKESDLLYENVLTKIKIENMLESFKDFIDGINTNSCLKKQN